MWQYQGQDDTCMIASVTGVLRQLGTTNASGNLITYPDVLFDIAEVRDQNGNILHPAGMRDSRGNPLYTVTIHLDRIQNLNFNIRDSAAVQQAFTNGTFHSLPQQQRAFTVKNHPNTSWGGIFPLMERYGVKTHHSGMAYSLYDIVAELETTDTKTLPNPMMIYVDLNEISTIGSDFVTQQQAALNSITINGITGSAINSGAAHMITITALDLSNPADPRVIINDTGATGGGQSVSLDQLFAAMSDYRFKYIAPNAVIPHVNQQQARRITLEDRIRYWYQTTDSTLKASLEATSEKLLATIQNPSLLSQIDANDQNFNLTEIAKEYLYTEARNQALMFERFGIPKGSIQNLYNNTDVLEFTQWTVSNAIRNNIDTSEVKSLLDHNILDRLGWTQAERDAVMNKEYLQGLRVGGRRDNPRHFTDDEINQILGITTP